MKFDKKKQLAASKEIEQIFQQMHQILQVNIGQNRQNLIFDYLSAIDNASKLLNQAWKVSSIYDLQTEYMRHNFIKMASDFEKIKKKIRKEIKKVH